MELLYLKLSTIIYARCLADHMKPRPLFFGGRRGFRTFLDGSPVVHIAQQQEPRSACNGLTPPPCLWLIAAIMVHLFSSETEYNWWGTAGSSGRRFRVQRIVSHRDFEAANQGWSGKTVGLKVCFPGDSSGRLPNCFISCFHLCASSASRARMHCGAGKATSLSPALQYNMHRNTAWRLRIDVCIPHGLDTQVTPWLPLLLPCRTADAQRSGRGNGCLPISVTHKQT